MKTRAIMAAGLAAPIIMTGFTAPVSTASAVAPTVVSAKINPDKRHKAANRSSRAAGVAMRTRGVRYSPNRAVNRLERWAKRGASGYHNQCLRLADNAYQPRGNRTSTALRQWKRAKKRGFAHPRNRKPAYGAQMFWRTSNPAGHIATYVGNGRAVTNMPGGRVKKIRWKRMNSWGRYLGWAEPFYG